MAQSETAEGNEQDPERATISQLVTDDLLKRGYPIYVGDVEYAIRILRADRNVDLKDIFLDTVYISAHKRIISPKSLNQKAYIEAIRAHDIVFGIGPAGTGKTYLAMAMALAALMKNQVTRMVLCRPAVEAGEKLGFLPGDLAEKVNPYLRPLYDALHDMVDFDRARRMLERGGTPGISFIRFNDRDVVRHRLVQSIILAYESFNADGPTPPP